MKQRFEVAESELSGMAYIRRVELRKLKDESEIEMAYRETFAEDGVNFFTSAAEELVSLLNDGLKYRGEYLEET
jgi:hypothetical protein